MELSDGPSAFPDKTYSLVSPTPALSRGALSETAAPTAPSHG
jgi:hypothetical protein